MKKTLIFAMLGLAAMLTLASPTQANARVVVGVAVGPVALVPHAYVYPQPYYPWAYGPVYPAHYWGPYWHPRVYGRVYYGPRGYRYYRR